MPFNSYAFLLLLIPAVALFWALPSAAVRRGYVLALSLAYYAAWNTVFLAVPLGIAAGVWLAARAMAREPERPRRWLRIGIAVVLLVFLFFRYRAFLVANLNAVLAPAGVGPLTLWRIAVPVGISFYCFEAIAYLIDCKQGRVKDRRFSRLYLFLMFWPNIVSGPIARFRELAPQFAFTKRFELAMLLSGLDRLVWGLVEKNFIANSLGGSVDEGFLPQAIRANTSLDNWALAAAFGLQIYFDFAAYTNMALGVAQLIGVVLPENFRFPYHAWNPSDFWSRWHMTLTRWIRDYLFFPVNARFRAAPAPLYLSLVGIMALVGLWHGAGWGFVAWGVMHGVYLVLYRAWEAWREKRAAGPPGRAARWGWRLFTLAAVTAAWVPFRASSVADAWQMLASMLAGFHFGISYSVNFYLAVSLAAVFCLIEPSLAAAWKRTEETLAARPAGQAASAYLLRPALYAAGLLLFLVFDDRAMQFIYFQF